MTWHIGQNVQLLGQGVWPSVEVSVTVRSSTWCKYHFTCLRDMAAVWTRCCGTLAGTQCSCGFRMSVKWQTAVVSLDSRLRQTTVVCLDIRLRQTAVVSPENRLWQTTVISLDSLWANQKRRANPCPSVHLVILAHQTHRRAMTQVPVTIMVTALTPTCLSSLMGGLNLSMWTTCVANGNVSFWGQISTLFGCVPEAGAQNCSLTT